LADVMVRHSRSQVSVSLPPRHAHTVRLTPSPDERALYDGVSAFVREQIGADGQAGLSSAHRFTLQMIQREIGSSPWAAAPTLQKLADRNEMQPYRAQLLALADRATQVESWAKADALEKLLLPMLETGAGRDGKAIIFTHFNITLERLAERLRALGVDLVLYHGGLSTAQKDEAIRQFEQQARVLLSTEAAGEGRNLQFCRTAINSDLPWNPVTIEQRVGRVHRIGQTRDVYIFNLCLAGSVEERILSILHDKINMFELVAGEVEMILGHLGDDQDFASLVMDAWSSSRSGEDARETFERLSARILDAKSVYQTTTDLDRALFSEDYEI
jgi:SNF2 family DNA or RNA helicase